MQARTAPETSQSVNTDANATSPAESCAKIRCTVWSMPAKTCGSIRGSIRGASVAFHTSSLPIAPSTASASSPSAIAATNV